MNCLSKINSPFFSSYLPLFEQINIDNISYASIHDQISFQTDAFNSFENSLNKTEYEFSEIFDHMEKMNFPLSRTFGVISHLSGVDDSKSVRDIKDHFRNDLVDLGKLSSHSKPLYNAIKNIKTEDDNEKRAIKLTIEGMERGGVKLPEEKKDRLTAIDKILSEQSTKLSENVLDAIKSFKKVVDNKEIMEHVPLWAKELWCSENPQDGPWTISISGPSFVAAMQHIPDTTIRKEIYMAYISKAPENENIIKNIMNNKLEKANLLGFQHYTDLSLSTKMADNESIILEMLNNLQDVSLPCAVKEHKEIYEYAQKHANIDIVEPWDISYWGERMREEKFNLKVEDLKPYFSLDNVLRELFCIANRLFGIYIQERQDKVEKWNKDVRYYDVFEGNDENNPIIAGFYLDPYVREETKRSGAWMDTCVDKNRALNHNIPVAYLVCNGSPPSKNKPSLLSFSDVETLFHEFGHGLQHMLTKIDIGDISGINSIEWMQSNYRVNLWKIGVMTKQL